MSRFFDIGSFDIHLTFGPALAELKFGFHKTLCAMLYALCGKGF